ncbi:hypothetical protein R3P38DRAFT_3171400 [Favolaschia claudopus]|uniref:Uncharacterized protein n=1 Tax=Favolaschia claudopus TaxID=2862362 RepID=A0AAW0DSK0_9AGAR
MHISTRYQASSDVHLDCLVSFNISLHFKTPTRIDFGVVSGIFGLTCTTTAVFVRFAYYGVDVKLSLNWTWSKLFIVCLRLARDRTYAGTETMPLWLQPPAHFNSNAETIAVSSQFSVYLTINAETMAVYSRGKPMPPCIARARAYTLEGIHLFYAFMYK